MIILGIDPGTANTGYGIIKKVDKANTSANKCFKCLDYNVIKTSPAFAPAERLKTLHIELNKLIKKYQPKFMAVEKLYFFKNLKTAIPVSQACGAILLTAAKKKIPVCQFTPLQIKLAIAGYGWAEKKQVQRKIKTLLNLKEIPKSDDAADGLAAALTYFLIKKPKSSPKTST